MSVRTASAALALLAFFVLTTPAAAQAPGNGGAPPPNQPVNLTMEQRHVIREIIVKDLKTPAQPTKAPAAHIGDAVPSGVVLQPMPVEVANKVPQLRTHSFFVRDDKVIIVDPKNNRIAAVVE